MFGLEINMIVKDSIEALSVFSKAFEIEPVEVGDFITGQNEVVLNIYGTRFHLLDENEAFGLTAPKPGDSLPFWFNIVVPDITSVFEKVASNGFAVIQPITEHSEMGISNAMLADPFGYVWMLHQINKEISYEERTKMFEEQGFQRRK